MPEKSLDEMLADINSILDEDDDDEALPDEDAPVQGVSTQHHEPKDATDIPDPDAPHPMTEMFDFTPYGWVLCSWESADGRGG